MMPKLYKVRTHGEMLTHPQKMIGYSDATIHWFREGRFTPAFPYAQMIPGWEDMVHSLDPFERNPAYAARLAAYADQLFSEEEAFALREHFLLTRSADVELQGIEIPLIDFEIPFNFIPAEPQPGEDYGFVQLSDGVNGPLPFRVVGYFDMEYPTPFARYQASAVKSLIESSGLSVKQQDPAQNDLQQLCDKLDTLKSALLSLQQSLSLFTRHTADGEK